MTGADIATISEIPARQARLRGDAVAIRCEGRDLTYADLDQRARQVAGLLQHAGVRPGDRVAWLGRSSEAWYEVFFGVAHVRACFTPINSRLAPSEIAAILADATATLLFVTPGYEAAAETAVRRAGLEVRTIVVGGAPGGLRDYASLRDTAPDPVLERACAGDDLLQIYTSGTTGLPKGVRLTDANCLAFVTLSQQVEGMDYRPGDVMLILMPLFHVAGTNVSFTALAAGGRILLQPDFSPPAVLQALCAEHVNHVFAAPAMISALLQSPGVASTDVSALRTMGYGASPISEAVLTQASRIFGCAFVQFYGLTETSGAGTTLPPHSHDGERLRSCGQPWPGIEVRITDAAGRVCPAGAIGEIEIRGPTVMAGYWNRPEATAETIRPDGWLRTGDAGFMDRDGLVFVHDRVKDMIVSGGENVYPAEVENAILGCPGVADAAVIGVPDDRWGEAVKAIIVPSPGARPDPAAVIAWARDRIAGFKTPKSIDFIDVLPRNPAGKVLRRELRAPYWDASSRQVG